MLLLPSTYIIVPVLTGLLLLAFILQFSIVIAPPVRPPPLVPISTAAITAALASSLFSKPLILIVAPTPIPPVPLTLILAPLLTLDVNSSSTLVVVWSKTIVDFFNLIPIFIARLINLGPKALKVIVSPSSKATLVEKVIVLALVFIELISVADPGAVVPLW